MKSHHLLCLALALVGCVDNPKVKIVSPNGTVTTYSTGRNLMAEVDEQVSEVEAPGGVHIRHMVKRQDATRVPIAGIQGLAALGASYFSYLDKLAEQVTTRLFNGEITQRQANAQLAAIEEARIAAGVSGATQFNPNIPLPIRK